MVLKYLFNLIYKNLVSWSYLFSVFTMGNFFIMIRFLVIRSIFRISVIMIIMGRFFGMVVIVRLD